jgi:hypothetical protein
MWQFVSAQYSNWTLVDQTPTQCTSHILRTNHMVTQNDEGICKVELYHKPVGASSFSLQQTYYVPLAWATDAYTDQTVTSSGDYYSLIWYGWITPNGPCYSGYSRFTSIISVTVDKSPTATYKVDGATVNTSTYLQTFACSPLQLTNMTLNGTGSNPAWQVSATKVGTSTVASSGWVSGNLPASYDLKALLSFTYGSGNLQGEYNVSVAVKNGCSGKFGNTYSGLVKVNANPSATSACFQISTNNTCTTFSPGGSTCASATNVCAGSPKLSGSCSTGQWVGGYYRVVVEEFLSTCVFNQTLISTGNNAIVNTNDVVCLDLNVLTSPQGYFFSNPTGRKYKVSWTIGNVCGESTSVKWFSDNISGCRIRGDKGDKGLEGEAGLGEASAENPIGFTVYPNPASTELNILWDTNSDEATSIRMFDVTGREVLVATKAKGLGEARLDVSGLVKGIYVVELNNGTRSIQRVVID